METKPNDPLIPIDNLDVDRYDATSDEEYLHTPRT